MSGFRASHLRLATVLFPPSSSILRSTAAAGSSFSPRSPIQRLYATRRPLSPDGARRAIMAEVLKNIDLSNHCDAFPDPETEPDRHAKQMESLYTVVCEDDAGEEVAIGYMLRSVYAELRKVPASIRGSADLDAGRATVRILRDRRTEPERTAAVAALGDYWRASRKFRILAGWRDELWPVYGRRGEVLFSMERSAMGLFGTVRYGVHMTAYVEDPRASHGIRIWVPTRAGDKSTYAGMLDNTVAGGLMTGEDPFECIVREADEEASLPDAVMRAGAREVTTISYIYITDERAGGEEGLIYPECQWVYDLLLPADVVPTPKDGEVASFRLCTVDEVKAQLAQGRFKPNCAVVLLDFFIRRGILTREDEPDFDAIVRKAHRVMPFPGPHQDYQPRTAATTTTS